MKNNTEYKLRKLIREEISKVLSEEVPKFTRATNFGNEKNKKSRRYVPDTIVLTKSMRNSLPSYQDENGEEKPHFRLGKIGETYKLYISPLLKTALDGTQRGRTPIDRTKLSSLTKLMSEKIPTNVRSILKNYSPKINPSLGMFPVNVTITGVTDGDISFANPGHPGIGDSALDPVISENESPIKNDDLVYDNLMTWDLEELVSDMMAAAEYNPEIKLIDYLKNFDYSNNIDDDDNDVD